MQEVGLAGLSLLVVEDEPLWRKQITAYLEKLGADVTGVATLEAARRIVAELSFDFVLLDVNLPDGRGTELLKDQALPAGTGTIVMTAEGGVEGAVEAMRLGALDYLVKPFEPVEMPLVIARAQRSRQSARIEEHRRSEASDAGGHFYFGSALAALEGQLQKILAADQRLQTQLPPVLLEGETGTGKTTIARWLHHQGPRAAQSLVEMNCSAVPETLAESELFGHERGAFTDARTARIGLLEAAKGGTLFLDELPSLSLGIQAKLLSAIEDRRIRRLGGNKFIPVDVRIIAASNRDLQQLVESGQFRADLYQRLNVYTIHLPALRERGPEIVVLAENFMRRLCQRHRLPLRRLTALGKQRLCAYAWPGNVRELQNELERAIIFEDSVELDFPRLATATETPSIPRSPAAPDWFNSQFQFPAEGFSLEAAINRLIQQALDQAKGNVSAAARLLGVTRDYVRYRLPEIRNEPRSEFASGESEGRPEEQPGA